MSSIYTTSSKYRYARKEVYAINGIYLKANLRALAPDKEAQFAFRFLFETHENPDEPHIWFATCDSPPNVYKHLQFVLFFDWMDFV